MIGPDAPLLLSEEALDIDRVEDRPDTVSDAALVPSSYSLDIMLPHAPTGRRDLLDMLTEHAPILPEYLVWTSPVAGPDQGATITVVQRYWLDQFVGDLEQQEGRILKARTARDRAVFDYASPAARRARSITLGTWIASLIVAGLAIIAAPNNGEQSGLADPIGDSAVSASSNFSQTGILAAIGGEPFGQLPEGLIASISGSQDGSLLVELNTQDPDALRNLIAESGVLPGYREFGQARNRDGGYLATYRLEGPDTAQPAADLTRRLPILRAPDAALAIVQTEQTLTTYAAQQGLQLGLIPPEPAGEAALEFDIELAGSQEQVLAAINAIERGSPPMRFAEWELTPYRTEKQAGIRLAATLIVPWTSPE